MKRVIIRFTVLMILITTGCFLYASSPAAVTSCWETTYNKWQGCDNSYASTQTSHFYAQQTCTTLAQNNCQQYQIGSPAYSSCFDTALNACILQDQQNYDNRGSSYGTCLGIEGNGNNCIEQLESCDPARDRAAACNGVYFGSEDGDALTTCLNNSGFNQCQ